MASEADARVDLESLERLVANASYTGLDPRQPHHGIRSRRWHVVANTEIEHDL